MRPPFLFGRRSLDSFSKVMSINADIVAHFTRMADAFASAPPIVDRQALDLLLEQTGASCFRPLLGCRLWPRGSSATSRLGTNARVEENEFIFSYSVAVLSARKLNGAERTT